MLLIAILVLCAAAFFPPQTILQTRAFHPVQTNAHNIDLDTLLRLSRRNKYLEDRLRSARQPAHSNGWDADEHSPFDASMASGPPPQLLPSSIPP